MYLTWYRKREVLLFLTELPAYLRVDEAAMIASLSKLYRAGDGAQKNLHLPGSQGATPGHHVDKITP